MHFLLALLLLLSLPAGPLQAGEGEDWILIDTQTMTLSVFEGDRLVREFDNISIGRRGASVDKRRGDETTPLGEYHVIRIARDSIFHRFYHLDYPTPAQVRRAWEAGELTAKENRAFRKAFAAGRIPPQYTVLGGSIGIHGVGAGDVRIHEYFNWTEGCVALTNEQIDDLDPYIHIGTRVVIR